jgi:NAD(P)-dependent dehydrogenase (short-subunit alcohol dehydrogenase family)
MKSPPGGLAELMRRNKAVTAASFAALTALTFCSGPFARRVCDRRIEHTPSDCLVLITGCDSGMGADMAIKLHSMGYKVIALCLTEAGARDLEGKAFKTMTGDVTKEKDVARIDALINTTLQNPDFPNLKLWAVVNNAGIAPCGFTDWLDMNTIKKVMDVNYFGVVAVTKTCMPFLQKTRGSRVIMISSLAGVASGPHLGAYSASKHALEGWTKALRNELAPFGVAVCNVNSGFLRTPLINSSLEAGLSLYRKEGVHRELYNEEMVHDMATRVKGISENPAVVINLVCDYLITHANPPLRNFAGWQAFAMRWMLMLPQSLIDFANDIMTPLKVNRALISSMQQKK